MLYCIAWCTIKCNGLRQWIVLFMDIDGRMCLVALPSRPAKEKYAWKPWKTMENHQENISIPTLDSRSGIQLRRNSLITPYLPHRTAPAIVANHFSPSNGSWPYPQQAHIRGAHFHRYVANDRPVCYKWLAVATPWTTPMDMGQMVKAIWPRSHRPRVAHGRCHSPSRKPSRLPRPGVMVGWTNGFLKATGYTKFLWNMHVVTNNFISIVYYSHW